MFKALTFIIISMLINGCSPLAVGTSEITGIALFNDRRPLGDIARDEQIELAVNIELLSDSAISDLTHFNVTSFNGVVLITGEAPGNAVRQKITTLARRVSGVRLLQNHMVLAYPSSLSNRSNDSFITSKVKLKFSNSPNMPGFDSTRVKVVTENAQVFLMGLVHKKEAYIATENARRVSGVKKVIKVFEYL
ncbi:MAG: BON domain-containing protein [Methylococcales bacterium]|nr:BON domain-containing protein [Methylococcales bacterium]